MDDVIGVTLKKDPRIAQAQKLLVDVLLDYQKKLPDGARPPDPTRIEAYRELISRCNELRGGELYYPYLSSGLGRGALVELMDGSVKYDFITGIGVHYLGHSHPQLLRASILAAFDDTTTQGNLQQSAVTVQLLELLVECACRKGAKLPHGFLTSSGAMANENALKMIFQKHTPAHRLLAFHRCFAGRTMVMTQITDKPANREGLPKVLDVDYVPFHDPRSPQESREKAVQVLQDCLARHPGEYAGMIFELVQGEGGYYAGDRDFFLAIIKILKKNNVAVFIDEIQTFGRTPEPFAFQYFGLDPYVDVVSMGKMTQVCATLFSEVYKPKPGLISQTFTATSSAIYAALAIIEELLHGGYLGEKGKIMQFHHHFAGRLEAMAKRHPPWLQGPFGFGAMIALTPFDGSAGTAKTFVQKLFENGVLSFIAGEAPTRVRFLVPVGAVTLQDIDRVCEIIETTLEQVAAVEEKGKSSGGR